MFIILVIWDTSWIRMILQGLRGQVIECNHPFLWVGTLEVRHCDLYHTPPLFQTLFHLFCSRPYKGMYISYFLILIPLTQGSVALALPKPSNRRFAVRPSLSCSKSLLPRSSQHFGDRISPSPVQSPQAVGERSVSEFTG